MWLGISAGMCRGVGGARQSMWRSITWGEKGGGRSDGGRDGEGDGGVC